MNRSELKKALDKAGISPKSYCLEGGWPSEEYCIEENYGKWSVYYSEHGQKTGEKLFYSESDACEYLYKLLLKDPTTRN